MCIYPCFEASWPLRDPTDIFVVDGGYAREFETNIAYRLMLVVYALVTSSALSSLMVIILANSKNARNILEMRSNLTPYNQTGTGQNNNTTSNKQDNFFNLKSGIGAHVRLARRGWVKRVGFWGNVCPCILYYLRI